MSTQKLILTVFCLALAQWTTSMSDEEFTQLNEMYTQVKSNMSGVMQNLDDDFFEALKNYGGLKDFVSAPGSIAFATHNYFSFTASYQIRNESKFFQPTGHSVIPEAPHVVQAEVRIYVEEFKDADTVEYSDIPRWNKAKEFAMLTCNGSGDKRLIQLDDGGLLVGNLSHYDRPYRTGMQKFYEQEFGHMELDLGDGEKTYIVNIMVAEGWDGLLVNPLANIYGQRPDLKSYVNTVFAMTKIGETLTGVSYLHGDVTLENMAINFKTTLMGDSVINPFVRLSDNSTFINNEQDYVDGIQRYSGNYMTQVFPTLESEGSFTYNKNLYEDSYALIVSIRSFINLNGLTKTPYNKGIDVLLTKAGTTTGGTGTYEHAWTPEDIYENVKDKLNKNDFFKNTLLI